MSHHLVSHDPHSRVEQLGRRPPDRAHELAVEFLTAANPAADTGERRTFAQLERRSAAIAAAMRSHIDRRSELGERVILAFAPGLAALEGLLACRRAGFVAVPVALAGAARDAELLESSLRETEAALVLCERASLDAQLPASLPSELARPWIAVDGLDDDAPELEPVRARPGELALLRPDPDSPTPTALTHADLDARERLVADALGLEPGDVVAQGWSLDVDPSLVFAALDRGASLVLAPDSTLANDPLAWLRMIHAARATATAAPPDRYLACARLATERPPDSLDLSCLRAALIDGPQPADLADLADPLAAIGLRRGALVELDAAADRASAPELDTRWQQRDLSHFGSKTGADPFEIHQHFAAWLRDARPGGYALYDLRLAAGPSTTIELLGDDRRHDALLNLASYNYLGLATRPEVIEAAAEAARRCGLSASGSPMLSGLLDLHDALERELAAFKQVEAALLFPSGYTTNLGVISALVGPGDTVVTDTLAHASIIDGIALSRADIQYFRHNSVRSLERVLARCSGRVLVAVEGVYSLDGDLAPLPEIVELCRRHGARLLVDEAHSAFLLGEHGRGAAEHFGVEQHVDVHVGTLSKTLGGMGGYVAGDAAMIDYVRGYARARTFSCALAPPIVGGLRAALAIHAREPELRARLWTNVAGMRAALLARGVDIGDSDSQVIPVLVNDDVGIFAITRELMRRGIYLNPIHYPAVRKHRSRFRISVSAVHELVELVGAAEIIAEVLTTHTCGRSRRPEAPR